MNKLIALTLITLAIAVPTRAQEIVTPPKFTPPHLVMYGYSDTASLKAPSGHWLTRELWEKSWTETFQHFNIITGKTKDADLVKRLRTQGKVFAYHVSNTLDAKHKTADDFVREWAKPFEDTLDGQLPGGFDAISIDELHSYADGSKESEITPSALRELRRRYPQKAILAWAAGKMGLAGSPGPNGKQHAPGLVCERQLQAAADYCDLLVLECFQKEGNPHMGIFAEVAKNVETRVPGLLHKTVFGLAISQSRDFNYDDRADVDFGEFLEQQFKLLQSDPLLRQTRGVAFWPFYRAKPELIPTINQLVAKYYGTPHPVTPAPDTAELSRALTFHASFDMGFAADFSRGDKTCYVRQKSGLATAMPNDEVKFAPEAGRFGGALHFTKKGITRPIFKGDDVLNYNNTNWSATVSVWLRLDPNKDLEPGYCDPVQITGDDSKKGFIFLEWSKDESPRLFRFAIRPLFHIWNPNNVQWADIPFDKRPMVQVARAPFSRDAWTHVVFSFANINDKTRPPVGKLYINGKMQGVIENWDLTFGWNPNAAMLTLGAAYIGQLDDLAVFNRALTADEVHQVYQLKHGIRELHEPKPTAVAPKAGDKASP